MLAGAAVVVAVVAGASLEVGSAEVLVAALVDVVVSVLEVLGVVVVEPAAGGVSTVSIM